MKKRWLALPAACMLLLAGCAGMALFDPAPSLEEREVPQAEEIYEEPVYEIVPFTTGNQLRSEDGKLLAVYNYQIVLLALGNADAVSTADADAAERNMETFNSRMRTAVDEMVEQGQAMAADAAEVYKECGFLTTEYEDDAEMSAVFCGEILSVCLRRSSYTGGAHPNSYVSGYLFDLASGQFILDPSQLADDPAAFQAGAAELLIEKADHEGPGGYWEDYQEIIRSGSGGATLFDEAGMRVVYAPYELGPYAIGAVELRLDWEELAPLLGPDCMARLGRAETE